MRMPQSDIPQMAGNRWMYLLSRFIETPLAWASLLFVGIRNFDNDFAARGRDVDGGIGKRMGIGKVHAAEVAFGIDETFRVELGNRAADNFELGAVCPGECVVLLRRSSQRTKS